MKIKVEVDCTPEELRRFIGLPDVGHLQSEMIEKVREKMQQGAQGYDPYAMLKPFLPENLRNLEGMQDAFWKAAGVKKNEDKTDDS